MEDLYWLSSHDYFLGSTVSPGHWGRVMSSYLVGVPHFFGRDAERLPSAVREYLFESVRLTRAPDRPSRLGSLFLCPSLKAARRLLELEAPARNHEYVYRIELVDEAPLFQASMDLATIHPGDTVASLTEKARRYWMGYETRNMEVLTVSPIRVCERVALADPRRRHQRRNGAADSTPDHSIPA